MNNDLLINLQNLMQFIYILLFQPIIFNVIKIQIKYKSGIFTMILFNP
jgi:hypothetical protein